LTTEIRAGSWTSKSAIRLICEVTARSASILGTDAQPEKDSNINPDRKANFLLDSKTSFMNLGSKPLFPTVKIKSKLDLKLMKRSEESSIQIA
jgi:hypothetical protein